MSPALSRVRVPDGAGLARSIRGAVAARDARRDAERAGRELADAADRALLRDLRAWARRPRPEGGGYGTVDAFAVALAERLGCSVAHARDSLYRPARPVLDEAVAMWREAEGMATGGSLAGRAAGGDRAAQDTMDTLSAGEARTPC